MRLVTMNAINYRLGKRAHGLLCEALRRFDRFTLRGPPEHRKPLREAWTGLGTATAYAPATDRHLMVRLNEPNKGYTRWFSLTDEGARIVQAWLDAGYRAEHVEADQLPPAVWDGVVPRVTGDDPAR
jgi:hypothetical protein